MLNSVIAGAIFVCWMVAVSTCSAESSERNIPKEHPRLLGSREHLQKLAEERNEAYQRMEREWNKVRLEHNAAQLLEEAQEHDGLRFVVAMLDPVEPKAAADLARILTQQEQCVFFLGMDDDKSHLYMGRSPSLDVDMRILIQRACQRMNARGGGSPHLVQAQGPLFRGLPELLREMKSDFLGLLKTE